MDLHFKITNEEDIQYLNTLDENEKENILQSALSIGLKSINMSQLHRDGLSYITPIKEMIKEENNIAESNKSLVLEMEATLESLLNNNEKSQINENELSSNEIENELKKMGYI